MKTISTISELKSEITKTGLQPLGLVPTMGALHEGHMSLVRTAAEHCDIIVVSIFVNPTQFNDKEDLKKYPRTLESDLIMLEPLLRENDIVFTPEVNEIYPEEDRRVFSFGNLDRVMEAVHRPGHFNGVAQVVSRLFSIVNPDIAYFGIKDFQQLAVIKELNRQMGSRIKIISCPIIREEDGLAMSSRNRLLEPEIRKNASVIYHSLLVAARMMNEKEIGEITTYVKETINGVPGFRVEYFNVADDVELVPVFSKSEMIPGRQYYGCIALMAGKVRLIDNILLKG